MKQPAQVLLILAGVCALAGPAAGAQQPTGAVTFATTEVASADANGVLIKSAYDAFSRGDVDAVMEAFAPDIVWHVPGRGVLSGDYRGRDQVLAFFEHFMELSSGTFQLRVDDVLATSDQVVVLCTETAQRGGRSWTSPQVHVWTVKNGKAVAFREYEGDQQAEDEFWSSQ